MNKNLSEIIRFGIVGCINTIVGWAVMFSLYNLLHVNYWISSAANYIVGSICSFFLNKYFTFTSKGFSKTEIIKFIVCIGFCYLIGYGVARPFARWIFSTASQTVQDNVAMIFGSIVFTILNYLGQKFFVFSSGKEGEAN